MDSDFDYIENEHCYIKGMANIMNIGDIGFKTNYFYF